MLKVDHGLVIDTSLIFNYSDGPTFRRPSLYNLCKASSNILLTIFHSFHMIFFLSNLVITARLKLEVNFLFMLVAAT